MREGGPGFWDAIQRAREATRDDLIRGAIGAAEDFRRRNQHPDGHPVVCVPPPWMYSCLRPADIEWLSREHAIEVRTE